MSLTIAKIVSMIGLGFITWIIGKGNRKKKFLAVLIRRWRWGGGGAPLRKKIN